MQNNIARWSLIGSSLVALALTACSGGAEAAPGPQAGSNGATDAVHADLAAGHHDPQSFVKRFDANGDGALEVAELPERMQKRLADADADHDGKLSVAELQAHRQTMAARMFQRADKNGDGALEADEVGKRWEHLKVADADGNGSVTAAELRTARQNGVLRGEPHGGRGHGKWLARLDKNGDGVIDASEVPAKMQAKLAGADANHDGKVTVEELRADFAAHRGEHRFARLDKNGDGAVTQDECDARVWQHVSRADANADGRVTAGELQQMRAQRVEQR